MLRLSYPSYILTAHEVRDKERMIPLHEPTGFRSKDMIESVTRTVDGMAVYNYDHPSLKLKHIFAGNRPTLESSANVIFEGFQTDVEMTLERIDEKEKRDGNLRATCLQ